MLRLGILDFEDFFDGLESHSGYGHCFYRLFPRIYQMEMVRMEMLRMEMLRMEMVRLEMLRMEMVRMEMVRMEMVRIGCPSLR